jgi:NAD(P)H-flavin reductase
MVSAENILKKNAAFLAPLEPVRWRSSMSAGPSDEGGANLHVKVVPNGSSTASASGPPTVA